MAVDKGVLENDEFVYRISTAEEWEDLQRSKATFGGDIDKSTGCIHLSRLHQLMQDKLVVQNTKKVPSTLQNFFLNVKGDLYLLQVAAVKLGKGLVYEAVGNSDFFPHFYGPSRSFSPLPLDAITKAEKLILSDGKFSCSLLN